MKSNIDLTENRDFAKGITHRIFTISEILFKNITNEEEFETYSKQHCDRCGKLISIYPWNRHYGLCDDCEYEYLKDETVKIKPLKKIKNDNKNAKLYSRKISVETPWFIRNRRNNIARLIDSFKNLNI